jgi:hypothetical protein
MFLSQTQKLIKKKTILAALSVVVSPGLRWISICEKVPSGMWRVTQLTATSGAGRSTSASWLKPNLLNESACARQNMIFLVHRYYPRLESWTYFASEAGVLTT